MPNNGVLPPTGNGGSTGDERWAHFRFSVVGPLLAAPPEHGSLKAELQRLADKRWLHPVTGEWVQLGVSTIERWYYLALHAPRDPVGVLVRRIRKDRGEQPSLGRHLREYLLAQYRQHPSWSYQLHADNVVQAAKDQPELGTVPSYASIRRFMKAHGLFKRPRRGNKADRGHTRGGGALRGA